MSTERNVLVIVGAVLSLILSTFIATSCGSGDGSEISGSGGAVSCTIDYIGMGGEITPACEQYDDPESDAATAIEKNCTLKARGEDSGTVDSIDFAESACSTSDRLDGYCRVPASDDSAAYTVYFYKKFVLADVQVVCEMDPADGGYGGTWK